MNNSIKTGQPIFDTNGKRIEAHGGAMIYQDGTFYWYGENKEFTDGKNGIWTYGLKMYSSKDFYNWTDLGYIVDAETTDESSPFFTSRCIDRPHIVYNNKTKKYVMWVKIGGKDAYFAILTADNISDKYKLEKTEFQPFGKRVGDFDIAIDGDGVAHLYFESDHDSVTSCVLTDDYLDVTDSAVSHYDTLIPPFCREAPAHFEKNGKHYLFTSGLTGYLPNPSIVAVSDDYHGPFIDLGSPHRNDKSSASFNSQISFVLYLPEKDLHIAIADRWVPDSVITAEKYDIISRAIASHYDPENYSATMEEKMQLQDLPMLATANTSRANYVILPVQWDGDKPYIEWLDEWKLEDFGRRGLLNP